MVAPGGAADHPADGKLDEKGGEMAVLGWIALGLVTAVLASGLRRSEERRAVLGGRYATGMVGALVGGFVAVAAGVGSVGDLFHAGTWLIALGSAVLALFLFEFARAGRAGGDAAGPPDRGWTGRSAGGESERLHRNW